MVNKGLLEKCIASQGVYVLSSMPKQTQEAIIKGVEAYVNLVLTKFKAIVFDDLTIHCGKFELFSKSGFPDETQIKFDGEKINCITSVNFFMDTENVDLKIGLEPYVREA